MSNFPARALQLLLVVTVTWLWITTASEEWAAAATHVVLQRRRAAPLHVRNYDCGGPQVMLNITRHIEASLEDVPACAFVFAARGDVLERRSLARSSLRRPNVTTPAARNATKATTASRGTAAAAADDASIPTLISVFPGNSAQQCLLDATARRCAADDDACTADNACAVVDDFLRLAFFLRSAARAHARIVLILTRHVDDVRAWLARRTTRVALFGRSSWRRALRRLTLVDASTHQVADDALASPRASCAVPPLVAAIDAVNRRACIHGAVVDACGAQRNRAPFNVNADVPLPGAALCGTVDALPLRHALFVDYWRVALHECASSSRVTALFQLIAARFNSTTRGRVVVVSLFSPPPISDDALREHGERDAAAALFLIDARASRRFMRVWTRHAVARRVVRGDAAAANAAACDSIISRALAEALSATHSVASYVRAEVLINDTATARSASTGTALTMATAAAALAAAAAAARPSSSAPPLQYFIHGAAHQHAYNEWLRAVGGGDELARHASPLRPASADDRNATARRQCRIATLHLWRWRYSHATHRVPLQRRLLPLLVVVRVHARDAAALLAVDVGARQRYLASHLSWLVQRLRPERVLVVADSAAHCDAIDAAIDDADDTLCVPRLVYSPLTFGALGVPFAASRVTSCASLAVFGARSGADALVRATNVTPNNAAAPDATGDAARGDTRASSFGIRVLRALSNAGIRQRRVLFWHALAAPMRRAARSAEAAQLHERFALHVLNVTRTSATDATTSATASTAANATRPQLLLRHNLQVVGAGARLAAPWLLIDLDDELLGRLIFRYDSLMRLVSDYAHELFDVRLVDDFVVWLGHFGCRDACIESDLYL